MRRLGLMGGMSWESTAVYYRLLNQGVAARAGGLHSAPLLIESFDFAPIAAMQAAGDWDAAGRVLAEAARRLERAGAEGIALTTNTMHHVAHAIEEAVRIPLLHIVDATGAALHAAGVRRAGLLGTRYTMELPFWRDRLADRFGVELAVPDAGDRAFVHRVIYDELCLGRINPDSRAEFAAIIQRLGTAGAEAVVFGCTEIALLIHPGDSPLPAFDTTALHADAAVDFILGAGNVSTPAPHASTGNSIPR
jgi:aspartate racemase